MDRLIFTAAQAMSEYRLDRHNMTHELANISTPGFKKAYEVANKPVRTEGEGFDTRFLPRAFTSPLVDLESGPRMVTGQPMDIAMDANTVMPVRAENGDIGWTRRGDLRLDPEGFLITGEGHRVLDETFVAIQLPQGSYGYEISREGSIFVRDEQNPEQGSVLVANLGIKDATGVDLLRRPDGLFQPLNPADEGLDFAAGPGVASVSSGILEGSTVNAVETLVKFIDHMRSFEMQTKIVTEMKENDSSGAAMMRAS